MKSSLFSLALLLSLAGSANAGVPGVPLDQTIVCSDGMDGKIISLTGTLVGDVEKDLVAFVSQDHVKFVKGTLTLSVSDAFDVAVPSDFFMSFAVTGSHKSGLPSFAIGQGYELRQTDTSPLLPAIESLVIEEIQAETQILQATLKFAGRTPPKSSTARSSSLI